MNLTGFIEGKLLDPEDEFWDERLNDLLIHYDLDLEEVNVGELLTLTPKVLHACKDFTADGQVDFDDQIWLPVVLGLPLVKVYDLLLVDEAQDLNRCQQALAKRAGRRLILCGDPQQAIYGFAGADSESMPRMTEELSLTPQGCVTLPLTMTRRCGKAIVQEAQVFVPTFTAHESNPAGQIRRALYPIQGTRKERREIPLEESYQKEVQEGDMLLCRVNAPLVRQCFAFLRRGRRANILGRDVGTGLVSLVKRLSGWGDTPAQQEEARSVPIATFLRDLHDWEHHEISKEQAQRNPSESKLVLIADKALCLQCFADQSKTVGEMLDKINAVFTDDPTKPGIRLSSIHKAKGLEAKRVFLLRPVAEGATIPHPMAKTEWQRKQEYNLLYVAVTRAIEELVYVD
jgi:superfamily I DNA/RNA helicase